MKHRDLLLSCVLQVRRNAGSVSTGARRQISAPESTAGSFHRTANLSSTISGGFGILAGGRHGMNLVLVHQPVERSEVNRSDLHPRVVFKAAVGADVDLQIFKEAERLDWPGQSLGIKPEPFPFAVGAVVAQLRLHGGNHATILVRYGTNRVGASCESDPSGGPTLKGGGENARQRAGRHVAPFHPSDDALSHA